VNKKKEKEREKEWEKKREAAKERISGEAYKIGGIMANPSWPFFLSYLVLPVGFYFPSWPCLDCLGGSGAGASKPRIGQEEGKRQPANSQQKERQINKKKRKMNIKITN